MTEEELEIVINHLIDSNERENKSIDKIHIKVIIVIDVLGSKAHLDCVINMS